MKILNIYGQEAWHTEARIIGNREGLESLKQTIDNALRVPTGKATTAWDDEREPLFASDGEGYEVIVEMHNDVWGIQASRDGFWSKGENRPQYIMLERQEK